MCRLTKAEEISKMGIKEKCLYKRERYSCLLILTFIRLKVEENENPFHRNIHRQGIGEDSLI